MYLVQFICLCLLQMAYRKCTSVDFFDILTGLVFRCDETVENGEMHGEVPQVPVPSYENSLEENMYAYLIRYIKTENPQKECPVCLEDMVSRTSVVIFPCGGYTYHWVCKKCAYKMIIVDRGHQKCPMCRHSFGLHDMYLGVIHH